MPSSRRVSFSEKNEYSRLPQDDEMFVMKAFSRHANKCNSCFDPYRVYREGGTLCPKGHQRALDVAQYVYNKGGSAYSVVDSEKNQRVQIEIPSDCAHVRSLLKAMERGLRVMKRAPTASYDRTYYVPARRNSERPASTLRRPSTSNLRLETVEPPRSPRPRHVRSRSYSNAKPSSRSPSPNTQRPTLSRYGSYTIAPSSSRNNSYSSGSSRDNSPFSSRNNSISSQSSYGSYSGPSSGSRKNSLGRTYTIAPRDSYERDYNKENKRPSRGYYSTRDHLVPLSSSTPSKGYDSNGRSMVRRRRDSSPEPTKYYKAPIIYRIKREPSPPVPPKDEYVYRRRHS